MLVTLKELLKDAKEQKYAVGAFNVTSVQGLMAAVDAAQELGSPVIVSHAQQHGEYIPIEVIGPAMLEYARRATVPVCVHLDHGVSYDLLMKAMRIGFTSVMFDGSALPYAENVACTREIVRAAHAMGVSVEAELGQLATSESGEATGAAQADLYTNPDQALEFVQKTGVDALAIAFGTAHGVYHSTPVLDFDRIRLIREKTNLPLVMHGGSGIDAQGFRTAIQNGICKINYYTYMVLAGGQGVRRFVEENGSKELYFHDISLAAYQAMKANCAEAIRVFYGK